MVRSTTTDRQNDQMGLAPQFFLKLKLIHREKYWPIFAPAKQAFPPSLVVMILATANISMFQH